MSENAILFAQPNQPRQCPVVSFKLYLSKLTKMSDLFQQPNPYFKKTTDVWYKAQPVGEGTIGQFLATISQNAGLSYIYTDHYTRGTTVTGMHKTGHLLQEIANVVKHKI